MWLFLPTRLLDENFRVGKRFFSWKSVDYRPKVIYYGLFIKISGIDAEDLPKGFEGQRAEKSDEDEGMEDEGQDENRHR